jgi:cell division cycle 2-like protein
LGAIVSPLQTYPRDKTAIYGIGMSSTAKSRWAEEDPETIAQIEQRKREKEAKKRAKEERLRKQQEVRAQAEPEPAQSRALDDTNGLRPAAPDEPNGDAERPAKRRRLSVDREEEVSAPAEPKPTPLLRFTAPEWSPCRHVDNFDKLNAIEEGSYGWVSRAKDVSTGEIVAIKKLKMENAQDGFPITGLREIQTLLEARHPHVVRLREVVMGDKSDE